MAFRLAKNSSSSPMKKLSTIALIFTVAVLCLKYENNLRAKENEKYQQETITLQVKSEKEEKVVHVVIAELDKRSKELGNKMVKAGIVYEVEDRHNPVAFRVMMKQFKGNFFGGPTTKELILGIREALAETISLERSLEKFNHRKSDSVDFDFYRQSLTRDDSEEIMAKVDEVLAPFEMELKQLEGFSYKDISPADLKGLNQNWNNPRRRF